MPSGSKAITVSSEISLFDIPFFILGTYKTDGTNSVTRFTVRVGDKTLGEVLRYILAMVGGPQLNLEAPWNVIENIQLNTFAFEIEMTNGVSKYGISYTDIGLDLTFLQIDKLEVFYSPAAGAEKPNKGVDINVFGTFLGVDFTEKPITWDALKEKPPTTPAASEGAFELDYLGLGQRVTLRDISQLTTVGKVIDALRDSYKALAEDSTDPLKNLPALSYDESAAWLIGAKFSVLKTFDFSGVWNLPQLAGARIALRGERAKKLAGFEFEILYRRIAEDLGQYHLELVLPDVLRRFQAGIASVTLPIIQIDIYTDGGFLIDLGFPKNLDFTKSFSIELIILGVPVTGALGVYFGVLSPKVVPAIPKIVGGDFKPVIVAGVGFRIGVGKSLNAGILEAGIFVGIEGLLEGVLAFYEPQEESAAKGTFYKVKGRLQLTGHIYGKVNFAIISAAVDAYAYVAAEATFESYRATLLLFEAGVSLKLSVKVGWGWFSFTVNLSFSTSISFDIVIGQDDPTPWLIDSTVGSTLADRIGPVAYRRLPTGDIISDAVFAKLRDPNFVSKCTRIRTVKDGPKIPLPFYFHPIPSIGVTGDTPIHVISDASAGNVNLVATLMMRLSREGNETLSPAEQFVASALAWGIDYVRALERAAGKTVSDTEVTLSELNYLADHLAGETPPITITLDDVKDFFAQYTPELKSSEGLTDAQKFTPFPMIPFLSLSAGRGDDISYFTNFEETPKCSPAYQQKIRAYFDALNQQSGSEDLPTRMMETEELSMTGLMFVDTFKMVLKSAVDDAIELMRVLPVDGTGKTLGSIATETGLDTAAGYDRIIKGNLDNKALFTPETGITIARNGIQLATSSSLQALAAQFGLPVQTTGKHIAGQPVLATGSTIKIKHGTHMLAVDDTPESILTKYGITEWQDVVAANQGFIWYQNPGDTVTLSTMPYPSLAVPAGQRINLPTITHTIADFETLRTIGRFYNAPLFTIIDAADVAGMGILTPDGLAYQGITAFVRDGETLNTLATRLGLPDYTQLMDPISDDPLILPEMAELVVPPSKHVIARGDTIPDLAARFQMSIQDILDANAGATWKLVARPNSVEKLPTGVTLDIPGVSAFAIDLSQSFADVAQIFSLPVDDVIKSNDTLALAPFAAVIVPPQAMTIPTDGISPTDIATPYAIPPEGLIAANAGTTEGQGADVKLGTVLVPHCEKIPQDDLIRRLSEGGENSKLAANATSLARFLLAGLRLPAPDPARDTISAGPDEVLYPLYTLTGQQWPAPTTPSVDDWVKLEWNTSEIARTFMETSAITADPLTVNLTELDIQLITGFAAELVDPSNLQPTLTAHIPYPSLEQIRPQVALGASAVWSVPWWVDYAGGDDPQPDPDQVILLHEMPRNLREALPKASGEARPMDVLEISTDPVTGTRSERTLDNIGWATRLELEIRKVSADGDATTDLPATYEVLSLGAQSQADLIGVRDYIANTADLDARLFVLYPANDLGPLSDTLLTDPYSAGTNAAIALFKSNLSTVSNPPTFANQIETDGPLASATLGETALFLELLWQIGITNGGGFFLQYEQEDGTQGLPDSAFGDGDRTTITIMAQIWKKAEWPHTIPPMAFHNALVTAQNLTSPDSSLVVTSRMAVVGDDVTDPALTENLATIAARAGITPAEMAALNASTPNLLTMNSSIAYPDKDPYIVKAGDTLLTVADVFGVGVPDLGTTIKDVTNLLHRGAKMHQNPDWISEKSTVAPDLGGFRILRTPPVAPAPPPEPTDPPNDIKFRILTMFQMMGYGLAETTDFDASSQGLPIMAATPTEGTTVPLFAIDDGTDQPWTYQRLLPIAKYAHPSRSMNYLTDGDPYAGLGKSAKIEVTFQDVFGNKLPSAADPVSVNWPQTYRDPLIPVHNWPSLTLAYDVEHLPTDNSPKITIRIKFAPAAYAASIGVQQSALARTVKADQTRYAQAYYQVADQRAQAFLTTSLLKDEETPLSPDRLAKLASDAFTYLEAVTRLVPLDHSLKATDTLKTLGKTYGLSAQHIADHLSQTPDLLDTTKPITIPLMVTVMTGISLDRLSQDTKGALTPAQIATLNEKAPLTPEIVVKVGKKNVTVTQGDTLKKLATSSVGVAALGTANRAVKSLFLADTTLSLGQSTVKPAKHETLAAIAHSADIVAPLLVAANGDTRMFAKDALAEIPLHLSIPEDCPSCAIIKGNTDLNTFAKEHHGSVRDIATANGAISGILTVGEILRYFPNPAGLKTDFRALEKTETIGEFDTLATIALRFGQAFGDPSIQAADIADYAKNAENKKLFVAKSRLLMPPLRITPSIDVIKFRTADITVVELATSLILRRPDTALINPAFAQEDEIEEVRSVVPARLSSKFSQDDRATLLAFARQFQKVFDNLKLAVGADTVPSTLPKAADSSARTSDVPSKLLAVQWDPHYLDAEVRGPASFFAPKPLQNTLWRQAEVPIYPYISGSPLIPPPSPDSGDTTAPTPTDFAAADLERWAGQLLRRIDQMLQPEYAAEVRKLSPPLFQALINAKQTIATNVAARVDLILTEQGNPLDPTPDVASAQEQVKQQLLKELSATYRGATVVQYDVQATAPTDKWTPETAPRLLCAMAPAMFLVPKDNPTLDGIADHFKASAELVAGLLKHAQNLLKTGATFPVGSKPLIAQNDTLATIAESAGLKFDEMIPQIAGLSGVLKAGAKVPLTERTATTDADETFGSLLETLAPNLTARNLVARASGIFGILNGDKPGIFVPDITLTNDRTHKTYKTTTEGTLNDAAEALDLRAAQLINMFWVEAPLLAAEQTFTFLAMTPQSTISASKISLFEDTAVPNKMNTVFVTASPDEASSVSLNMGYKVQAMEYKVQAPAAPGDYQASDWLTFVDWTHGQDLGTVTVPVPNRQFPLPPTVLSHEARPVVPDGSIDPADLPQIMAYDYHLTFAFDAATQDALFYTQAFKVPTEPTPALVEPTPENQLAFSLAQYQAIDAPLWEDLDKIVGFATTPPSPEEQAVARNALEIFTTLAGTIGGAWATWVPKVDEIPKDSTYRIRRHAHPDGRAQISVSSLGLLKATSSLPTARLVGRKSVATKFGATTVHNLMDMAEPIPRTRRGDVYQVRDPNLSLLREQQCWGEISVTRNGRLVDGRDTQSDFILHIRNVKAVQYLVPSFVVTQRIDVGTGIGTVEKRLTDLLNTLFFSGSIDLPTSQLVSVSAAFTRQLVQSPDMANADPADAMTLFTPVVTTPALTLTQTATAGKADIPAVAEQLATYLNKSLSDRGLTPDTEWGITLKLFSSVDTGPVPSLLLEITDLRMRMSDT